jgi:predicted nucleotidyltransferase component of viral defense system
MDCINYKKLYKLQDHVLDAVFETENEFYLTGGTCLSRFYNEKRYSDDLDFFTNSSSRYNFAVKNIKLNLNKKFQLEATVESKDFTRFRINNLLQVDFVNDTIFHYKDIVITNKNYLIDNIENILSNKITAVLGRDNPKDIFDIFLISKFHDFSWNDILKAAHKKTIFNDEDLIIRLKNFPPALMNKINIIDKNFLDNFDAEFPIIIDDIFKAS